MSPANHAARLTGRPGHLAVGPTPYPTPGPQQIIVRNAAVAINPVDWIIQISRAPVYPWIKQGAVLGYDLAGEVVEVGGRVARFAIGDRVLGLALGAEKNHNTPSEGAFQLYTAVSENVASPIPDDLSFTQAAVLPLGLSTAACGLFQAKQMGLTFPNAAPVPAGETLLVWGGSTSVGANAIQLAVAAGYDVITTCSLHNDGLVRSLGASQSLDYHSPAIVTELTDLLRGRQVVGAISLGTGSALPCLEVLRRCDGKRFLSQAAAPVPMAGLADGRLPLKLLSFVRAGARTQISAMTKRIPTRFIQGASLAKDEVGPAIYQAFLPSALAEGRYRAVPEPRVVGNGLQSIQAALDVQRAGVSAQKLVVTLGDAPAPRY